jgi:hypothetical protein
MAHTVLIPDASEHIASPNDAALLLADLVRAVRLGGRVRLLKPLAQPLELRDVHHGVQPGRGMRWSRPAA